MDIDRIVPCDNSFSKSAELELSSDLTMLAWMLVASDEATAGSVIPKHDLFGRE